MRGRYRFVGLVMVGTVVLAAACGRAEEGSRKDVVAASFPMAGVSARMDFKLQPLQEGELGADAEDPLYHRFLHRCSGCHVAPSPIQRQAGSWPLIVDRMARNVEAAGLLPMENEEAEAIASLLQRHAPDN